MQIDILAFAPHPDDAELYCAGTLLSLKKRGYRTGIVDVTRGELSTRGTTESRAAETHAASKVLNLDVRDQLGISDGHIENTIGNRLLVIEAIRRLRPSTVLLPSPKDRHPDHGNTSTLVREAVFQSGLAKIASASDGKSQEPHRPTKAFYYMMTDDFIPSIIVDISDAFEDKMQAIRCYETQFQGAGGPGGEAQTYISTPAFMESLIARSKRLGFLIGTRYGEGFEPVQAFGVSADVLLTSRPL